MKSGELMSTTHKIAQDYYSELLGAKKNLIAKKQNYVNQKYKMLEERQEYFRQRKITATFERVAMIKKYYGEYNLQAIKVETIYINKYGSEDGLTNDDVDVNTGGYGDTDHQTGGLGNTDHHSSINGSDHEEGF